MGVVCVIICCAIHYSKYDLKGVACVFPGRLSSFGNTIHNNNRSMNVTWFIHMMMGC